MAHFFLKKKTLTSFYIQGFVYDSITITKVFSKSILILKMAIFEFLPTFENLIQFQSDCFFVSQIFKVQPKRNSIEQINLSLLRRPFFFAKQFSFGALLKRSMPARQSYKHFTSAKYNPRVAIWAIFQLYNSRVVIYACKALYKIDHRSLIQRPARP